MPASLCHLICRRPVGTCSSIPPAESAARCTNCFAAGCNKARFGLEKVSDGNGQQVIQKCLQPPGIDGKHTRTRFTSAGSNLRTAANSGAAASEIRAVKLPGHRRTCAEGFHAMCLRSIQVHVLNNGHVGRKMRQPCVCLLHALHMLRRYVFEDLSVVCLEGRSS